MCLNWKQETWSMTFGKGQQSPRYTDKGQSGISRGKGFQESSNTHLLESLQAYLIQVWQQQGGLCYPWRFSSALHDSRSVILLGNFQLYFSATWPPRLLTPPCAWSHSGSQWGALCPLGAHIPQYHELLVLWDVHLQPRCVSKCQQVNHARVSSPMSQGMTPSTAQLELFDPNDKLTDVTEHTLPVPMSSY